jgi:lysophospholipase L1-like esterase
MPKIINDCKLKTVELFKNYKELTSKNNTDLITFTFPVFNQLSNLDNNEFHLEMNNEFSKFNLKFYNLQPCYDDEIKANYTDPQDYYWKIDGHHNAKGYEMMAKCLEEIVTPLIEKRIENQNTLVN